MRYRQFIIAIALCALAGLSTADARNRAEYVLPAIQDIYCLKGRAWGYPGTCRYSTYGQCMATASGTGRLLSSQPSLRFRATPMATALMGIASALDTPLTVKVRP